MLIVVVGIPLLPLLISGRWGWWEAWAYAAVSILGFVASRALAARRHPDLLAERAHVMQQENVKPWDRVLAPLVVVGGGVIPLVAGLDARFAWSAAFGSPARLAALALMLTGYVLATYALVANRFFSGMVRIQDERGHQVVSSGPYQWIRHPGYAGGLLASLGAPILLDSLWALVPAAAAIGLLIIRTALEDATLRDELEGYKTYAERVRYRLVPGIW